MVLVLELLIPLQGECIGQQDVNSGFAVRALTQETDGTVRIEWTDSDQGGPYYILVQCQPEGMTQFVARVENGTECTIPNLVPGEEFLLAVCNESRECTASVAYTAPLTEWKEFRVRMQTALYTGSGKEMKKVRLVSVSSLTDPDASVLYGMKAEVTHALLRETRSMRWTIVLHLPDGDVYTLYSAENPLFQGKQKQRQTFELDLNEPFRNILQWKQRIPTGICKVSLYLNGMHACDSTLEISE